jgi:enterochelin esterase family protein
VALFKKYNFDGVCKQSECGHTWINWREYLNEFVSQLFK